MRQQYVAESAPGVDDEASLETDAAPEPEPFEPSAADRQAAPAAKSGANVGTSKVLDFPARRAEGVEPARREIAVEPARFRFDPDDEPEARAADRPATVERSEMVKGYEFEKGRFVVFTPAELKALQEASRQTIDIVAFVPERSVDPIYYDKPYFLAPDRRGERPYSLLLEAMRATGRSALGRWAWRSKEYVVQIRAAERGLVLQQLLYADEVRSLDDLRIELVDVGPAELQLAKQLIEQIAVDAYDPTQFVDEEKARILAAVERKIAGQEVVAHGEARPSSSGEVLDLMQALRASLSTPALTPREAAADAAPTTEPRKPARRSATRATSAISAKASPPREAPRRGTKR